MMQASGRVFKRGVMEGVCNGCVLMVILLSCCSVSA